MDYRDYQVGAAQEHFWFKAKAELIEVLFLQLKADDKLKILNIGAGTGDDLAVIKKFGPVHAIDIEQNALDLIPSGLVVEKRCADACALPYEDNSFDVVVAFDVLEHIENDQKAVDEIYRVLRQGGSFIFTVPAFNRLYSAHDKALHHFRRYNKQTVSSLFGKFQATTLGYWFFFLFIPAAAVRFMFKKSLPSTGQKWPSFFTTIFYQFLRFENWLISCGITFPFGLTVYGIYKKSK